MMTTTVTGTNFSNEALQLAEMGFKILPIKPGQKVAALNDWPNDATTNEEWIETWWSKTPDFNIGILADGLVVVDVDVLNKNLDPDGRMISCNPNDWQGAEYLSSLECPIAETPTGGRHYFFKLPEGITVGNSVGKLAPGVDIRSGNGYVVAAPSQTINGSYRWLIGCSPADAEIPDAPSWLISLLNGGSGMVAGATVTKEGYMVPDVVAAGTSDAEMTRFAGYIRRSGVGEETIYRALCGFNKENCGGRKPDGEMRRIAKSIASKSSDQMTEIEILGFPDWQDADLPPMVGDPGPLPLNFLNPPGLMGDITRHSLQTAFRQQPEMCFSAALCLMAAITSGRVMSASGMRTNLYVLGLGPPAGGKDHGRAMNMRILKEAEWEDLLGPEDAASHVGIINGVAKNRCSLWQIDEFGRFLGGVMGGKTPSHLMQVPTVLLRMFTSSNSQYRTPAYADVDTSQTIEQPHLNVYGTAVGNGLMNALTTESISDGLLARILIFEAPAEYPPQREPGMIPIPATITDKVKEWRNWTTGGNLVQNSGGGQNAALPKPREILYTPDGQKHMDLLRAHVDKEINKLGPAHELLARVVEKTIKLAMLYACSVSFNNPVMDSAAVDWASQVVMHLTRRLMFLATTRIGGSKFEKDCLHGVRVIREAPGFQITDKAFGIKMRASSVKDLDAIKASMVSAYGAYFETIKTKGRSAKLWRLAERRGSYGPATL